MKLQSMWIMWLECRQVPFSTEQALRDMARLLSQMKRESELGNNIYLNSLLTHLGNVSRRHKMTLLMMTLCKRPFWLLSHMYHSSSPGTSRRYTKQTWGTTSLNEANVSKMLEILTLANHPCWIAYSGQATTLNPRLATK